MGEVDFMTNWEPLFQTIDRKDADGFVSYLTQDASFKFGNALTVAGRDNVHKAVMDFFNSIKDLKHAILGSWDADGVAFVQGEVTYTRKDNNQVTIPFSNLFKLDGPLIREYWIYIDPSPLFS